MATFSTILGFLVLIYTCVLDKTAGDPCSTYNVLTGEIRRSTAYTLTPSDTAICDNFLTEQWYRIDSAAGNEIVRSCPAITHCGTMYPLWMNGTLPLTSDGEVDRIVCQSGIFGCCESSLTIKVKNCGTFYVYYLKKPSGCPISYCFGTLYVNTTTTSTTTAATPTTTTAPTPTTTTDNPSTTKCPKGLDKHEKEHKHHGHTLKHILKFLAVFLAIVLVVLAAVCAIQLYKRRRPKTDDKVVPEHMDEVKTEKEPLPSNGVVIVASAPPVTLVGTFIKKNKP